MYILDLIKRKKLFTVVILLKYSCGQQLKTFTHLAIVNFVLFTPLHWFDDFTSASFADTKSNQQIDYAALSKVKE